MKVFGSAFALLVLGLGFYIYTMRAQTRDVAEFCSAFPEGSPAANLFVVAESYSGQLMGSAALTYDVKPQPFIYCAPLTMCDVSCRLEVIDGVITKAEYRSL